MNTASIHEKKNAARTQRSFSSAMRKAHKVKASSDMPDRIQSEKVYDGVVSDPELSKSDSISGWTCESTSSGWTGESTPSASPGASPPPASCAASRSRAMFEKQALDGIPGRSLGRDCRTKQWQGFQDATLDGVPGEALEGRSAKYLTC